MEEYFKQHILTCEHISWHRLAQGEQTHGIKAFKIHLKQIKGLRYEITSIWTFLENDNQKYLYFCLNIYAIVNKDMPFQSFQHK